MDFKAVDIVSVLIPAFDRGHCDNRRLPCVVDEAKQKSNHILYILRCKFGILDQGYHAKEIEAYLGALELPLLESYPVNKKSRLREYPVISCCSCFETYN